MSRKMRKMQIRKMMIVTQMKAKLETKAKQKAKLEMQTQMKMKNLMMVKPEEHDDIPDNDPYFLLFFFF